MKLRLVAIALLLALPLLADDTLVTLKAGGLVPTRSTTVRMKSEELRISAARIEVGYEFENAGAADVEATVAFPLPALDGPDIFHEPVRVPGCPREETGAACDPINFVAFRLEVDGQPKTADVEVRAWLKGKDITERVRQAGLPVSVIDRSFQAAVKGLAAEKRAALEKQELIVNEESFYYPVWQTRVQYFWKQRFPAHQTVKIRHSYAPVVGGRYWVLNGEGQAGFMRDMKALCPGPGQVASLAELTKKVTPRKDTGERMVTEDSIGFVLRTARNWSGPIGDFHLTVVTAHPEDVPLSCAYRLRQTGPTTYEVTRKAFLPRADILVNIITAQPPAY